MAGRKEQKETASEERRQFEEAEVAAARRRRMTLVAAAVLAILALGAVVAVALRGGEETKSASAPNELPESGSVPKRQTTDLESAVEAAGCTNRKFRSEGADHVDTPVTYDANPPHSGSHAPVAAEDGAYAQAPPTESLVHSLEHGRVIIQFKAGTNAKTRADLKALFDEDAYHVILTPNGTKMTPAVAATAWTRTLSCPSMNPRVFDALRAFTQDYRDKGPELVP